MIKSGSFILVILILVACSDIHQEEPDGKWDDNIKLSQKEAEFEYTTDSVTITTEGTGWWLSNVSFNDSVYVYNPDSINIFASSFSIKDDCFVIEKRNNTTLFIRLNENNSDEERVLGITLQSGNYFDYVTVRQKAD
jgi:hypothetical protein